jgi:hypothetical protein
MPFINPIELLQLHHYDLDRLSPEVIESAAASLAANIRQEKVMINDVLVDEGRIQQALGQLKDPDERAFYYHLAKYPGLTAFLYGDSQAMIEEDALRLHASQLMDKSAAMLETRAEAQVRAAFQDREFEALAHFQQQIGKGSRAFQEKVYRSSLPLLAQRRDTVQRFSNALEAGENISGQLKGLQLFREHIPVDTLNVLPAPFAEIRDDIRKQLGRMVNLLSKSDTALALAIARYAHRIKGSEAYTQKLAASIDYLQRQHSSVKPSGNKKAGTIIAIAALLLLAGGIWYTISLKHKVEATLDDRYIGAYEKMKEKEQQEVSPGAAVGQEYAHLPWYERGDDVPGTGIVENGSAPMMACFPTISTRGPRKVITVVGDPSYDALVFFFNGKRYFQQAYIPAGEKYLIEHNLGGNSLSTMIIFGQEWKPEKPSPCGSKGFFSRNVFYAGFSSYATDPPYMDLSVQDVLMLKKSRLMPSRQKKEYEFFELLEKYR